ncbi:GTP cyclohydrolase II [Nocardia sp. NPDC004582]
MTTALSAAPDRRSQALPAVLPEPEHWLTRRGRELRVRVEMLDAAADSGCVLIFGDLADARARGRAPLVRLHSRCLYGDALESDDCDCGPELSLAMDLIQAAGVGVLVYLEQEGRGEGLLVKARGLRLSEDEGVDTFDSYERLGKTHDSRSFQAAACYLRDTLKLTSVRLMTNSPHKIQALTDAGLAVGRVPLETPPRSDRARRYLEAKQRIRGHELAEALSKAEVALQETEEALLKTEVAFTGAVEAGDALHDADRALHKADKALHEADEALHEVPGAPAKPDRHGRGTRRNTAWLLTGLGCLAAAVVTWLLRLPLPPQLPAVALGSAGFILGRVVAMEGRPPTR